VKGGNTHIAFVEDPTGYKWELIQREPTPEPLCQVSTLPRTCIASRTAGSTRLIRWRSCGIVAVCVCCRR
jgi:hypothetical protein